MKVRVFASLRSNQMPLVPVVEPGSVEIDDSRLEDPTTPWPEGTKTLIVNWNGDFSGMKLAHLKLIVSTQVRKMKTYRRRDVCIEDAPRLVIRCGKLAGDVFESDPRQRFIVYRVDGHTFCVA